MPYRAPSLAVVFARITLMWLFVCANCAAGVTLYLSTTGSDHHTGQSLDQAIKTLSRAQSIVQIKAPNGPVKILIASGNYRNQSVYWRYINQHPLTIEALDLSAPRPVFDGLGQQDTWFRYSRRDGGASQLHIRHLQVQNYNTAISLEGNRTTFDQSHHGSLIEDMIFSHIGGQFSTSGYSTAALRLVNSRNNRIENCQFDNILNPPATSRHIHAIYLAHHSSDNQIINNQFYQINGDPIRVRDESNDNIIALNSFKSSGSQAFYSEWFCNSKLRSDCTKPTPESPSNGNRFYFNRLLSGYSTHIPAARVFSASKSNQTLVSYSNWQ